MITFDDVFCLNNDLRKIIFYESFFFVCLKQSQFLFICNLKFSNDEEINTIAFTISVFQMKLNRFFFKFDVLANVTKMDVLVIVSVKPALLTHS